MTKKKPKILDLKIGKEYKTRGGWKAIVIWVSGDPSDEGQSGAWVIHKPDEGDESNPTFHDWYGRAQEIFSVGVIPSYGKHPADLAEVWPEIANPED